MGMIIAAAAESPQWGLLDYAFVAAIGAVLVGCAWSVLSRVFGD